MSLPRAASPLPRALLLASLLVAAGGAGAARAEMALPAERFGIEVEFSPFWQSRNRAGVPGDGGTRFDLDDLTGAGPYATGRFVFEWNITPRHRLEAVAAPLELSGRGTLERAVDFRGESFAAGEPTRATYRFSTYRLGYRYRLFAGERWQLRVGITGLLRDAKIRLSQPGRSETESNVGVVPLLHLGGDWRLRGPFRLQAEIDGFAVPAGRAFDASLKAFYDVDSRWSLGLGYRTLEGGSDGDTVFTFAWLHYAVLALQVGF